MTLIKDTFSFIRFINILQATELNKGQIKYSTYYMRQTFKYNVSVSGGYQSLLDLKQTNRIFVRLTSYYKHSGWKKRTDWRSLTPTSLCFVDAELFGCRDAELV